MYLFCFCDVKVVVVVYCEFLLKIGILWMISWMLGLLVMIVVIFGVVWW